jgi:hypothetical protein
MELDHEKLDVYRTALDFAVWAYTVCRTLKGLDRPTRDQLLRASQSMALNIAEGCGKIPAADRGVSFRLPAVLRGNAVPFWTFSTCAESSTKRLRVTARTFWCGSLQC